MSHRPTGCVYPFGRLDLPLQDELRLRPFLGLLPHPAGVGGRRVLVGRARAVLLQRRQVLLAKARDKGLITNTYNIHIYICIYIVYICSMYTHI